jgi:hypothetical protein
MVSRLLVEVGRDGVGREWGLGLRWGWYEAVVGSQMCAWMGGGWVGAIGWGDHVQAGVWVWNGALEHQPTHLQRDNDVPVIVSCCVGCVRVHRSMRVQSRGKWGAGVSTAQCDDNISIIVSCCVGCVRVVQCGFGVGGSRLGCRCPLVRGSAWALMTMSLSSMHWGVLLVLGQWGDSRGWGWGLTI